MKFFAAILISIAALHAEDPVVVWNALLQPTFDPEKSVAVHNASIVRDRVRLTFREGTLYFARPVNDTIFGAAFVGQGRIEVQAPNETESQQVRRFLGKDSVDMAFSEAALTFVDNTAVELGALASGTGTAGAAPRIYQDRQRAREDVGAETLPRLFKSILSGDKKRTALFIADLKSSEKGWINVRVDPLEGEDVTVGRWAERVGGKSFETWLSFPAGNRSAAEAYRDPLAREDFRIRSYGIEAAVTKGAELRATTRVALDHRVAGERVLLFELDANLRVESVKDIQGGALPFFQPRDPKDRSQSYGDYVAVVLPEPTRMGQSQTLEFRYAGKRVIEKVGSGSYFCQSYGWYPTRPNSFAARADFEMGFRFPKDYKLVATGNKISETTDGNVTVTGWKSDLPLAVAGFAFGDYKVLTEKAGSVEVEVYANRQPDDMMASVRQYFDATGEAAVGSLSPSALAKTMALEVANMIQLFGRYFGPYPYKRLAVTNIPFSYGQGWPTLIYLSALSFLDSTQRTAMGITHHTELTDFFRAHEASHQWWGHRVGWKSYHDQWLSEGFAQFSGNLYVQYRKDEKEYVNRLKQDKIELLERDQRNRVYESLGPLWLGRRLSSVDSPRGYSKVVYNKGGFVLHMLRAMLYDPQGKPGDSRFIAMMQEFCQTYHNKPASTEDFKAVVEKHMLPHMDLDGSGRMDWFFGQYVYGTGIPQYQFRYTVENAGEGRWKVKGATTPKQVPPGWKDALRLYVHVSGKTARLGWLRASDQENPFEFVLPFKPEKLSLNHNEDTLAEVKQ